MARRTEQNEKRRDDRRDQIMKTAREQFAARGLSGTKITDISEAAGISPGLIYHYYASKEELFAAVIEQALGKLNEASLGLERMERPPHEKIRMAVEQLTQTLARSPDFNRTSLLIAHATQSADVPQSVKDMIRRERELPYGAVARIMAAGQREGTLRPGDPAAWAQIFWSVINGFAIYRATRGEDAPPPDADLLSGLFIKEEYNMSTRIRHFMDDQGRLRQMPAKLSVRKDALAYLITKFDEGALYTEREVNDILHRWHTFNDHTTLRREMVDSRLLGRTTDGAQYWRITGVREDENQPEG